jgi:hypothetical protein
MKILSCEVKWRPIFAKAKPGVRAKRGEKAEPIGFKPGGVLFVTDDTLSVEHKGQTFTGAARTFRYDFQHGTWTVKAPQEPLYYTDQAKSAAKQMKAFPVLSQVGVPQFAEQKKIGNSMMPMEFAREYPLLAPLLEAMMAKTIAEFEAEQAARKAG